MSETTTRRDAIPTAAWRMLALGVAGQAAGTLLICTPAYLIPLLHVARGMPLSEAGLFAAAPNVGMVLTLVVWGALADRFGERRVIAGGLALTALFAFAAASAHGLINLGIWLVLSGAAAASTNAASGRVVVGWFPRPRRGLAMGIRQMSQPLGVAVAALVVPTLAEHHGIGAPLALAGVATAVIALACALGVVNPPRPATATATSRVVVNPYSQNRFLVRIHLVSVLLVVPQFTLSIFGLIWLISALHWGTMSAGAVIATAQFVGALGRVAVGVISDRVGSRVGVLRGVAVSGVVVMVLLALSDSVHWGAGAAIFLVVATTVSVADNGLAFTSVAEAAGVAWSGKALGIQNTGQFVAASAVGPSVGALIAAVGYPLTFGIVAVAPLAAIGLVPRQDQHSASEPTP